MDPHLVALLAGLIGIPLVLVGYIALAEAILRRLPARLQGAARPWLWLMPALMFALVFLVYPTLYTIALSLLDAAGNPSLANFVGFFTTDETLVALRNNAIWLVLLTTITVGGGLAFAVLFDRVRYESAAKAVMFMPLAISFVGAGVIWRFMLDYRPPGSPQTGTLNALLGTVGIGPVPFLLDPPANTVMLILVAAWIWTGFCMVILSAAVKGISGELLDAARVDGASEPQVFRRITLPLLLPVIGVLAITMVIASLKAFDVVYVMTNGSFETDVIANRMVKELFTFSEPGRASAIAVILLLLTVPAMFLNLRNVRRQRAFQ